MTGRIHSLQSLGTVDGPGVRFVVFFQGCPLRCAYCHNPDTWDPAGGREMEAADLAEKILRYRPYLKNGGATASGGEPLLQPEFCGDLFSRLQKAGVHTALDTSGVVGPRAAALVLPHTDLVLCDLKFPTEELYRAHTGGSLAQVLAFLQETEDRGIPLWIRHVVVPGLTDGDDSAAAILDLAGRYRNLEKVEFLPFRKLCLSKYQALGISFPLADAPECPQETIARFQAKWEALAAQRKKTEKDLLYRDNVIL